MYCRYKWQDEVYNHQISNLAVGSIVVAIDYSKNIAHKEYHQWYGEWWLYQQSTMLPIVVLIRVNEKLPPECHQHIFITGDLVHDAAMADNCLQQVDERIPLLIFNKLITQRYACNIALR